LRILADENIFGVTVDALKKLGHNVVWACIDLPGESDEALLRIAAADSRLVLTLDKDFGDLAFKQKLPAPHGVILLRVHGLSDEGATEVLIQAVVTRNDWSEYFSVIEPGRIRVTPLSELDAP
jgi:predicted nuclease of predicted toxin-antitoxin system